MEIREGMYSKLDHVNECILACANAFGVSLNMLRENWSSRMSRASAPYGVASQAPSSPLIAWLRREENLDLIVSSVSCDFLNQSDNFGSASDASISP